MKTPMRAIVVAMLLHISGLSAGHADVVIRNDLGGVLQVYDAKYRGMAARGEKIVIDGDCASGCTIILGLVPRANVCITARARFGFHRSRQLLTYFQDTPIWIPTSPQRQAEIDATYYDVQVRAWIAAHGPQTEEPTWMTAAELSQIYQWCDGGK